MPPLWANAVWPTQGWRGSCRKLAISSTNCESSRNCASEDSGTQRLLHLEREVGDDAGEVAVAGALAVAVDRALDVGRARLDRRQRVGHAQPDVVVGVDAEPRRQLPARRRGDGRDLARQASRRWCRTAPRSPRRPSPPPARSPGRSRDRPCSRRRRARRRR